VAGTPLNGVWIVALMKDEAQTDPKHVCDIVFTAKGRPTTSSVVFEAASVTVKAGDLSVLSTQGAFSTAQVPKFGDLNWDNAVSALDFITFVQAWREYNQSGMQNYKALADLAARSSDPTVVDPDLMISQGDDAINALDFTDFVLAWREYNKTLTTAASAPKEGSQ
jgi:hypothetical protein